MGTATGQSTVSGKTLTIAFVVSERVTTEIYKWDLTADCRSVPTKRSRQQVAAVVSCFR